MRRYEVWDGDLYLGIFWTDEVNFLIEACEATRAVRLDD
jgi:hypothetical protein